MGTKAAARSVVIQAVFCLGLCAPVFGQDDAPPAEDAAAAAREARLTKVEGSVYLHLKDAPDGEFIEGEGGSPLDEGDQVRTGAGSSAEVTIDGDSLIELSENTDFIVNSLDPARTEFELGIGSLIGKIRSLLQGQALQFRTPTAVAAVRGTELALAQRVEGEPARVGVFDEGRVSVQAQAAEASGANPAAEVVLGPGQETEVKAGAAPAPPKALKYFTPQRAFMARTARRVSVVQRAWVPKPLAQRAALRGELLKRRAFKASQLKNVREDIRRRGYERLKARREELKKRAQELRERRREEIKERRQRPLQQRQERLRQRREQAVQEQRERRQHQQERREEIRQQQMRQRTEVQRQRKAKKAEKKKQEQERREGPRRRR